MMQLTSLELCAGAGGQALGLEMAGFDHAAAVEWDEDCCATLVQNRPNWGPVCDDVRAIYGKDFRGIDLLAAGVPCPPFSIAGKQLGAEDDRDLFPATLRIIRDSKPAAVLIENVRGLASSRFSTYRSGVLRTLHRLGYAVDWQILNACNFGVPQLRPRFLLVALRRKYAPNFSWPQPIGSPGTVGAVLSDLIGSRGWAGAERWAARANGIAPTIVGGSKKHGGPDLGPTRAKSQWAAMGVDGHGIADLPPASDFPVDGRPKLTVRMAARLQGFPDTWDFTGRKTAAYRQVGNAFPPPVANAVGSSIRMALQGEKQEASLGSILFQAAQR